jgi:hypothetical protein
MVLLIRISVVAENIKARRENLRPPRLRAIRTLPNYKLDDYSQALLSIPLSSRDVYDISGSYSFFFLFSTSWSSDIYFFVFVFFFLFPFFYFLFFLFFFFLFCPLYVVEQSSFRAFKSFSKYNAMGSNYYIKNEIK